MNVTTRQRLGWGAANVIVVLVAAIFIKVLGVRVEEGRPGG